VLIKKSARKGGVMRITIAILICATLSFAIGCKSSDFRVAVASEVVELKQQNRQCEDKLKKSQARVEQLKKQVATLSELKSGLKLESIYNLQSVKITRYTGFYENEAGKKERLVVYIQPIDDDGDIIKAAGSVAVQLWDLDRAEKPLLAQWQIEPNELKKMWVSSIMGANYRLPFDVGEKIADVKDDLTVRVTFTDYIFGKIFTAEHVIKRD
jgi:hypothetical protein